jgi:hypothetical protein
VGSQITGTGCISLHFLGANFSALFALKPGDDCVQDKTGMMNVALRMSNDEGRCRVGYRVDLIKELNNSTFFKRICRD